MNKTKVTNEITDSTIHLISSSKNPITDALAVENKLGTEFLNGVLLRSIELGNMHAANKVYKTMLVSKFYRANLFITAYQTGRHEAYLNEMSEESREALIDDIIVKINMGAGDQIDIEALSVIRDSLKTKAPVLKQ